MHAKEIIRLFDSSVRKLKKIYGTEALNVSIGPVWINESDNMAECHSLINWEKLELTSRLHINDRAYLKVAQKFQLEEEILKFSIMNTACHEMAHYLEQTRMIKRIRNEFIHDKKAAEDAIRFQRKYADPHGESWKEIMDEMGARHTPYQWHPCQEMPKIFAIKKFGSRTV